MPLWNNTSLGLWTDSANWSGGVPNGAGAIADFVMVGGSGASIATFTENTTVSVGTLNISSTGARDILFQGSLTDSGSGVATLRFNQGASGTGISRVNITTAVGGGEFEISSFGGLQLQIGAETEFNVATAGTTARIHAPIIGSGNISKLGAGTLLLGSSNTTFDGIIHIEGGTLYALNGGALGDGIVQIHNNAILRASGTVTAAVGTEVGETGTAGSGQIMAPTGTTLSLTGGFGHRASGILTLGNTVDNGTIGIGASSAEWGDGSNRLAGGTIRFDNAYSAGAAFFGANTALTELVGGVILDGRGFQMNITNLDLDNGTVRSSTGALQLLVSDTTTVANAQTGTIEGTASADKVEVNITNDFSFAGTTFSNWSSNDVIQLDGSANANNITGSTMKDTFTSGAGNDVLIGNGGADIFFAGDNDDLIVLNALNGNSSINGGNGTDTLRVTSGNISLAAMSGIEAVELQSGATLALTNGQFFSLPGTAAISGTGTISVGLFAGQSALTNNFVVAGGSNITFNITGAGGNETITIHPDAIGIISDGGGIDTITGGNRGDTFNLSGGTDTVSGGAGNDLFALSSGANGSFLNGGADTDTLRIVNSSVSLGSVSGFEAIDMVGGTVLTLTGSQFANGFDLFSALSGSGTITVNLAPGATTMNARGMSVAGGSNIHFDVNGTSGNDVMKIATGSTGTLLGGAGFDLLIGGDLADTVNGGTEIDKIRGGGGADLLTGGDGADVFKYRSISDAGVGAQSDTITDFLSGTDKLNFGRIDTDAVTAGDQGFTYVGTGAFTGGGTASIRYVDTGADLRVDVDVDGDAVADMQIMLQGAGAQTLTIADFVL